MNRKNRTAEPSGGLPDLVSAMSFLGPSQIPETRCFARAWDAAHPFDSSPPQ
ncbi:uncharacterized protein METZ01_LOCUS78906 [marine metagenome]|uniref:Uncharacterized protein n=1 Tax=marine metagenome TaxID=408172 RepID=A0A381UCU9_9ZZZZ